ncbi:MAG TPA: HU family DNA-binding protein [Nanoarchaeota archaeon]|nr:HU family DNA-binding protein [Nanoarchaeota archaeon]
MTYKELKIQVSKNVGLDEEIISKVLDETFFSIKQALRKDERIQIPTFGVFHVKERKERKGINPRTRKKITISAKKIPIFTPSYSLRKEIEKGHFET